MPFYTSVPEAGRDKVIAEIAYDKIGRHKDMRFASGVHMCYDYDSEGFRFANRTITSIDGGDDIKDLKLHSDGSIRDEQGHLEGMI